MTNRRITRALCAPLDGASLAAFRIAFGGLMVVAVGRYFAYGWIEQFFIAPRVYFPYPHFEWIVPLPAPAMYALFAGLAVLGACIALGVRTRASAALFCLGATYIHLIDRTNYLNHYYLVSLVALLLAVVPSGRVWSFDARRSDGADDSVPAWAVWLLRFQLSIVYIFGAAAKLNPDWLLHAQPLRIWLGANIDLPLLGPWLEQPWAAYACSYAGLLFDATAVPLLLCRRTRKWAYALVVVFHVLTALLFPIGMFPWLMIALTPIFFAPDWPRRLLRRALPPQRVAAPALPGRMASAVGVGLLAAYALVQVALPLRHLVYDGDLYWSESGFRWGWQIMVMEKYGRSNFTVTDPITQTSWRVVPSDELTPLQVRMMSTQPDMILSYARHLADDYRLRLGRAVQVRTDVFVSLNGRPHARLVDPRVDLAALPADAGPSLWILPRPAARQVSVARAAL